VSVMKFKDRLKELRHKKGLTQEQLANAIDIPGTTVRRWEAIDSPPKRERLELLADFFDVNIDYLLGRTDDPSPKASLGERLKALRNDERLSHQELSKKIGVPVGKLIAIEENKEDPGDEIIKKISDYFNVPQNWLLGRGTRTVYGSASMEGEGSLEASFVKETGSYYAAGDHEFIKKAKKLAEEHGMELTDPKFLDILEAAFDFAKRITQNKQD